MKDSCRRQFVDYICSSEVLNGFGFIALFVSNSVLYLILVVFLLGGGECYLVTVDLTRFLDVLVYLYCLINRDI